jgi:hypothetical protein
LRAATEKAITLTNPRLKVLPACHSRLAPAVEHHHRIPARDDQGAARVHGLCRRPPGLPIPPCGRSLSPRRISRRCLGVRTICAPCSTSSPSSMRPAWSSAWRSTSSASSGWRCRVNGAARRGADQCQLLGPSRTSLRPGRIPLAPRVGVQVFEYLLAQALAEIGEDRVERQELEGNRALIRARLRLLQQQGPGLGSMFGSPPAARERAGQAGGRATGKRAATAKRWVAASRRWNGTRVPARCARQPRASTCASGRRQLRLTTMNVVLEKGSRNGCRDRLSPSRS